MDSDFYGRLGSVIGAKEFFLWYHIYYILHLLDHAKRDLPAAPKESAAQAGIVAARFFEIPAEAIANAPAIQG